MIGGNVHGFIQQKNSSTFNAIGERVQDWVDMETLYGWLDLMSGDSNYTYAAKLQESTHIFICDYAAIGRNADDKRMVIKGLVYDVLLIDNPMEMNEHLEIYLKFVG